MKTFQVSCHSIIFQLFILFLPNNFLLTENKATRIIMAKLLREACAFQKLLKVSILFLLFNFNWIILSCFDTHTHTDEFRTCQNDQKVIEGVTKCSCRN